MRVASSLARPARTALSALALGAVIATGGCSAPLPVQGGVGGAAVGAGIGYAAGGRTGALLGGLIGGASGALAGFALQESQRSYAGSEQQIEERTVVTQQAAAELRAEANRAERAAYLYEAQLMNLRKSVAAGMPLDSEQRRVLAGAQAEREQARRAAAAGEAGIQALNRDIAQARRQGMDTSALEAERARLIGETQRLRAALRRFNNSMGGLEV